MSVEEAWDILGRKIEVVNFTIKKFPLEDRPYAIDKMIEFVKKQSKKELARNHPDKGGDPAKFCKINEASEVVESYLVKLKNSIEYLIEEKNRKDSETKSRWIF
jgi:hypothetical protein